MAKLPAVYKTSDLPDSGGGLVHIPDGQYQAVIVGSEFKPTKDGQGQYLALKIVLTHGQYANTEFTERLNLVNKNQTAVEIAYKTLARISEAVGMTSTPDDSNQLHNKPFLIDVGTEAASKWKDKDGVERDGKEKSIIKKYHPVPSVGGFGTPAFAASVAQPVAAQATGAAPWAK